MSILDAALDHARKGRPVFPCNASKKPLVEGGFKAAATDERTIREWWSEHPSALIGMPTGPRSGFWVLDMDVKTGADGEESLAALAAKYGRLPHTVESLTMNGGRHLYFRYPPSLTIPSSVGKLGNGLDVRGDGGYVILPPSTAFGRSYQWEGSSDPDEGVTAAEAPDWLLRLTKVDRKSRSYDHPRVNQTIAEGARNDTLFRLATTLRSSGLTEPGILVALRAENDECCKPPLPDQEIGRIAKSALRYESGNFQGAQEPSQRVSFRRLSDVEPKPTRWLRPQRIARGKVTVIGGDAGLGKSQLTVNIGANVSTGGDWPVDGGVCDTGNVVFVCAEDDAEDTMVPRLQAADADLARCFILDAVFDEARSGELKKRLFSLKDSLGHLENMVEEIGGASLVVIDPISAFLDGVDSHRNSEVRSVLAQLADLAARQNAAIVCITHINKSANSNSKQRFDGSYAFVAGPRAVYLVAKDQENEGWRLLLPVKNNIGDDKYGFSFAVEGVDLENGLETSRIVWGSELVATTADEALAPDSSPEKHSETDEVQKLLLKRLKDRPVLASEIEGEAKHAGISEKRLRTAKEKLGIKSTKTGFDGGWEWRLPPTLCRLAEGDREVLDALGQEIRSD